MITTRNFQCQHGIPMEVEGAVTPSASLYTLVSYELGDEQYLVTTYQSIATSLVDTRDTNWLLYSLPFY